MNLMKYRGVIFDLDGTLLDTLDDLADALNRVLRERGLDIHPRDAYRFFVGGGAMMLVSRALPPGDHTIEFIAGCVEAFRKEYRKNWNIKTRPYDGVPALLDSLTEKGIKMAVLSNKPQEFVELCVREYLPDWNFAMVLGERDGIPVKPNPGGAFEIARNIGLLPREFVFVGDSGTDMETAVRAGMFPLGVLWGFRSEKELRGHGATSIIGRPIDILKFV